MSLNHLLRLASILIFFCCIAFDSAVAAPDKYYHDRCRSLFDEKSAISEPNETEPLVMAVFGDSIMWGQGLKERDKFWCRTKQWLEAKTGRLVHTKIYAHAGAVIDADSLLSHGWGPQHLELLLKLPDQGPEVNVGFPTIREQVRRASEDLKNKVDLVLVGGCINDVNFRNLINVEHSESTIQNMTRTRCGQPMQNLLSLIVEKFPAAYVVVSGYYPIIYQGLKEEINGKEQEVAKGSAYNELTKRLFQFMAEGKPPAYCEDDRRKCLGPLSLAWYNTSNSMLRNAVEAVKCDPAKGKGCRIHFAEMNFPPEYGFSTKQSMLWNIRFGATNVGGLRKVVAVSLDLFRVFNTNDDRWDERGRQCARAEKAFNEKRKEFVKTPEGLKHKVALQKQLKFFETICRRGSLGHPNRFGAALYAQTIISQLEAILPETGWGTAAVD